MTPRERNLADIGLIALRFNLTRWDVLGRSHKRKVVDARRAVVMHYRAQGKSFPEIGAIIGRHHTSVMNLYHGKGWRALTR